MLPKTEPQKLVWKRGHGRFSPLEPTIPRRFLARQGTCSMINKGSRRRWAPSVVFYFCIWGSASSLPALRVRRTTPRGIVPTAKLEAPAENQRSPRLNLPSRYEILVIAAETAPTKSRTGQEILTLCSPVHFGSGSASGSTRLR